MTDIPQDIMASAMVVADSEVNFGSYEVNTLAIARAILAERKRCADIATRELRNTARLLSSPPQSSAAWDIRNAINRGEQP